MGGRSLFPGQEHVAAIFIPQGPTVPGANDILWDLGLKCCDRALSIMLACELTI